jgi:hypothetical protein
MYRVTILYTDKVQTVHVGTDWLWLIQKHRDPHKQIEKLSVFRLLTPNRDQLTLPIE